MVLAFSSTAAVNRSAIDASTRMRKGAEADLAGVVELLDGQADREFDVGVGEHDQR